MAQQDSSLTLNEYKQIGSLLAELKGRRILEGEMLDKEYYYRSIIGDYQNNIRLADAQIKNLQQNIEAVEPAWYDHFWVGTAIAGLVVSGIYLLGK